MQSLVILTPLILIDHGDYCIRCGKAGNVVDMTMSVVAGDSAIEPDHGLRAQIIGKHLLIGRAIHGRVALLDAGEQAFLSCEQCAAAVDVDRSAFERHAALVFVWTHEMSPGGLCHPLAIFLVELVNADILPRR